jgi:hypothetical protein
MRLLRLATELYETVSELTEGPSRNLDAWGLAAAGLHIQLASDLLNDALARRDQELDDARTAA